jgi:hypothetical protein
MVWTRQGPTAGNSQPAQQPQANPSSELSETQGLLSSNNPSYQGAGVIAGGQSAGIAQSGLTMEQLLGEIGLTGASAGEANQYAAQQLEEGLTGAGLTQGQNYLQGLGLQAQAGQTAAQQGFTTAEYNLNATQYPEQLAEAAQSNKTALQGISTSGAAAGTGYTQGQANNVQNQNLQYGWQQQDIGRAQGEAALGQQAGLSATQYSLGDIARSEQNLQLTAAANGLSVEQLKAQFAQGVNTTGTGAESDLTQLYTQYLAQQGSSVGDIASAGSQLGLLSPGSILSTGQNSGLNLSSLFEGNL